MNPKRIVVKVGTSLVTTGSHLNVRRMARLARELAQVSKAGKEVVLVSSGAIAAGLWAASGGASSPVRVLTAGGDELVVGFVPRDGSYEVTLTGPADVAFAGEWTESAMAPAPA